MTLPTLLALVAFAMAICGVAAAFSVDMRSGDRGFYLVWALLFASILCAILSFKV